jgi:transposase
VKTMNEATGVVGIDVAKRKLDIALLVNGKTKFNVFDNIPAGHAVLQQWLAERGAPQEHTHICMEATGPYSEAVAITLVEAGWRVSVVNPARIKGFVQGELARNKTDRADAALLARFCAAMCPSLWTPPSPAWRELHAWVDRLQALKDMHQQESNRLEAHAASGQRLLVKAVQAHLDWLGQQIDDLERTINGHIDRHPDLKGDAELLHSIPGIGKATVAKGAGLCGRCAALCQCQGPSGVHWGDPTAACVRQLRQRPYDDEPNRACRFTPGVVHAGPGSQATQPRAESIRGSATCNGVGSKGRGGSGHA